MTRFTSRLIFLAALLWLGCIPSALALRSPTPLPSELAAVSSETRVGGCDQCAPGRSWLVPRLSLEIATGSEACGYESASGQQNWLNRDPLGEAGGINLYQFVGNNPINATDPYGLFDPATTTIALVANPTTAPLVLNPVVPSLLAAYGIGYLLGKAIDAAAERLLPDPGSDPLPMQRGAVLRAGEYRDQDGNVRNAAGDIEGIEILS